MHDNLRNLGLDVLEVVNFRIMIDPHHPAEGSIEAPLAALAELQRKGLVRHMDSATSPAQIAEGAGSAKSSACRTTTIWCSGTTTP